MITKAQATQLAVGSELHYTGKHPCRIFVGPRGGKREDIVRVRVSGKTKTWKTRVTDFRTPVKYGLYESAYCHYENGHGNFADFHLAEDCQPAIIQTTNVRTKS